MSTRSRNRRDHPHSGQLSRPEVSSCLFIIPPFSRPIPRNGYHFRYSILVCMAYSWIQVGSYSLCVCLVFVVLVWFISPTQNNYYEMQPCGRMCSWTVPAVAEPYPVCACPTVCLSLRLLKDTDCIQLSALTESCREHS